MRATTGLGSGTASVTTRDRKLARALRRAGIDFAATVACGIVAGVSHALAENGIAVIDATREEEGVGLCAGAALAGRTPALLLQNSGIGNSANALASLTGFYRLPLVLIVGARGGPTEFIAAQRPMGRAYVSILRALDIPRVTVRAARDAPVAERAVRRARAESRAVAVVLPPEGE